MLVLFIFKPLIIEITLDQQPVLCCSFTYQHKPFSGDRENVSKSMYILYTMLNDTLNGEVKTYNSKFYSVFPVFT